MRLKAWSISIACWAAASACTEEPCKQEPATLYLTIESAPAPGAIASLRFILGVGGELRQRVFELTDELDDGETSIAVTLEMMTAGSDEIEVQVFAHADSAGSGPVVGSASQRLSASADGCNQVTLKLSKGPGPDAGQVDAGFLDTGPRDQDEGDRGVADRGADDRGQSDGPPSDAAENDSALDDVGAPDGGPSDAPPAEGGPSDAPLADDGPNDFGSADAGPNEIGADLGGAPDAGPSDLGQDGGPDLGPRCGDGIANNQEACDGLDFRSETCMLLGLLTGQPQCDPLCASISQGSCLGPINTVSAIRGAVGNAAVIPGHQTIAIQPGTYDFNTELELDECELGCPSGPAGVTLRPIGGEVIFRDKGILVLSGRNVIDSLIFVDVDNAVLLDNFRGANGGFNVVKNNLFLYVSSSDPPEDAIAVQTSDNQILSNLVDSSLSSQGLSAIYLDEARRAVVAMNVIRGSFEWALWADSISNSAGAAQANYIDHNSIWLTGGSGLRMTSVNNTCLRSNIVYGTGTSTGARLTSASLGSLCNGGPSGDNVMVNHLVLCTGTSCASLCNGGGPICDRSDDPGFTMAPISERAGLCLRPSPGNPLIDAGTDRGYDLLDLLPAFFNGVAPDVGAREASSTRSFGGRPSVCP